MGRFYHWLLTLFKRKPKRRLTLAEFEQHMTADLHAQISKEVAVLKGQHAVEVADAQGVEDTKPQPARPEDEAKLPPVTVAESPPASQEEEPSAS